MLIMTKLSQIREEFTEASCPTGAPQEQIQDMQMAFDAGATVIFQMVLEMSNLPEIEGEQAMSQLAEELTQTAMFHGIE